MNNEELKHVIALLLEDAKRLQQVEPNAGTAARIEEAKAVLNGQVIAIEAAYIQDGKITDANRSMSEQEKPGFESDCIVIMAADAALAATSEVLKDATDDAWFRQKLIKAALEAALASVIVIN